MQKKKVLGESKLPSRENSLWKDAIKFHEESNYKKALKALNTILKRVPDHGSTLAMKGLVMADMKEDLTECEAIIKTGISRDMGNSTTWHIYGLFHRGARNYGAAVKAYTQAIGIIKRENPDVDASLGLLRDLSALQLQCRDYDGLIDTRITMLGTVSQAKLKSAWLALCTAFHLAGRPEVALRVLDATEKQFLPSIVATDRNLGSELAAYRMLLLEDHGRPADALAFALENDARFTDKLGMKERIARLQLAVGDLAGAAVTYRALIARNPEADEYHTGLVATCGLRLDEPSTSWAPDAVAAARALYVGGELAAAYPKSLAVRSMRLRLAADAEFRGELDSFLPSMLRKGTPSLYALVALVANTDAKRAALGAAAREYRASLDATGALIAGGAAELPSTRVWLLYLIAQHELATGAFADAAVTVEAAIAHSPTIIDLYSLRARIFSARGALVAAARDADFARSLDLADRFLNCEAVRALLAAAASADDIARAEALANLFIKDPARYGLHENQAMWFESALAAAHARLAAAGRAESLGPALRVHSYVLDHFSTFYDDQQGYHSWCMANYLALCAYIRMVRVNDNVRSAPQFAAASRGAIAQYLRLAAMPAKTRESVIAGARARTEAAEARAPGGGASDAAPKKDDAFGAQLMAKDALKEAKRLSDALVAAHPRSTDAWATAVDVAIASQRPLLALRALSAGRRLAPSCPVLHAAAVRLAAAASAADASDKLFAGAGAVERAVAARTLGALLGCATTGEALPDRAAVAAWNDAWLAAAGPVLDRARVAGLQGLDALGDSARMLAALDASTVGSLDAALDALALVQANRVAARAFAARALAVHPLSDALLAAARVD